MANGGYHTGKEWRAFAKRARPIIAARLPAPCVNRCGRLVYATQRWHVGHIPGHDHALTHEPPTLETVGPSHFRCNTSAGATLGNQLRAKRKATATARDTRQLRLGDR